MVDPIEGELEAVIRCYLCHSVLIATNRAQEYVIYYWKSARRYPDGGERGNCPTCGRLNAIRSNSPDVLFKAMEELRDSIRRDCKTS